MGEGIRNMTDHELIIKAGSGVYGASVLLKNNNSPKCLTIQLRLNYLRYIYEIK